MSMRLQVVADEGRSHGDVVPDAPKELLQHGATLLALLIGKLVIAGEQVARSRLEVEKHLIVTVVPCAGEACLHLVHEGLLSRMRRRDAA